MKLAALFSGGKDSTFAIFAAKKLGHTIECLVTIHPKSDESHMLHHPCIEYTALQAKSMGLPHLLCTVHNTCTQDEILAMRDVLLRAKNEYGVQGLVHGGILSRFQKNNFSTLCHDLGLSEVSPLWNIDQTAYMHTLLKENFEFILTGVSSDGLDKSWLGKSLTIDDLSHLEKLSCTHSFNISFEGGEAETLVINCPLFSKRIIIKDAQTIWDGYRGRFEILEAELDNHA